MTDTNNITKLLADQFAAVLREWASDEEWATMLAANATPEYQGSICASHDFCDANMAMDEAFRIALDRAPDVLDHEDGTEGRDVALWNAAWTHAKAAHLTQKDA